MKRAAVLVSALAVVLYTVGMSAQAKPSFAGKWTMDAPAGGAAPAGGGGGGGRGGGRGGGLVAGMEVTITQDATMIKVDRMQGQNAVSMTVKLDGSESKNSVMGRGGAATEMVSKATWEGAKLVINTTGGPMPTKQMLSLDAGNLVVENAAADGTIAKVTYKKGM